MENKNNHRHWDWEQCKWKDECAYVMMEQRWEAFKLTFEQPLFVIHFLLKTINLLLIFFSKCYCAWWSEFQNYRSIWYRIVSLLWYMGFCVTWLMVGWMAWGVGKWRWARVKRSSSSRWKGFFFWCVIFLTWFSLSCSLEDPQPFEEV